MRAQSPESGREPRRREESSLLGRELGGDLPCVVCGYNLRGLSIRGVCPECGAGVRATILAVVDPQATVLRPIAHPRLIAGGLVLWAAAGLAAALICWTPQVARLGAWTGVRWAMPDLSLALLAAVAASAVGAIVLIRPHGGVHLVSSIAAACAVALYIPLGWALIRIYRTDWAVDDDGLRRVLLAMACAASIFLLLRPNARLLVARCLLLRSGRVDRQTLFGMAAAALVLAVGHGVLRLSEMGSGGGDAVLRVLGLVFLLLGAALLTLGLLGSVVDSVRIARAILRPRRTLRQILRSGMGSESGQAG
jgi:hypothetical protein